MNDEKIERDYLEKIKLLKRYNKKYFDENKSIISDADYDNLKKEIFFLEKKYSLKHEESPSNKVGYKPQKILKKLF